jgi:hypothetical protein
MKASSLLHRAVGMLPVLALLMFWLPLLQPLAQRGMMTCSPDGAFHLFRVLQLDILARQGILWPRWLPGMVYGYGYPLFDFYPVLAYYPALILHRLSLSLLQSWNLSLALSMLASGLTMYLWARQVLGSRGGFVAAVAYMLAPYQLYDVYWRGSAEALAFPLLPLVMWAARSAAQTRRWRFALVGVLAYAALLLTHVLSGVIFTLALAFYLAVLVWAAQDRRTVVLRLAGMITLALGLAALFLVPAYVEKSQVQLWRGITPGGLNFHNYFVSLSELLGPAPASDPLLINPSPPQSLGWAASLLALIGVLATWWGRAQLDREHKHHITWASLTLIAAIVMMLPVTEPIWARLPFMPFIQFPWRFSGVGSLAAALLAGAGVAVLDNMTREGRRCVAPDIAVGLCAVMLAAGAAPWAYPRLCPTPDEPTQSFYTKYERSTGLVGTTSSGEYLPAAVQAIPTDSPMVKALRAGQPVIRWDAPAEGVHILQARDDGLSAELVLECDASSQIVYRAFYFPGWQATLDGRPTSISIAPPLGLMAIDVPAGQHTVAVRFGSTPLRTASEVVSLVALLVFAALGVFDLRTPFHAPSSTPHAPRPLAWIGLAVLGVTLFALKLGVVDRYDTLLRWRRLGQDGQFKGAEYAADAVVADAARLLGYDVHPGQAASGDRVTVDLYWTLARPLDFSTAVRLLDERGIEWSQKSELDEARGSYNPPPSPAEWPAGSYADDRHIIRVLPGTPPGNYMLVALPFTPETQEPLPISSGQSAPSGYPGVVIGKLQVVTPARPMAAQFLDLASQLDVPMGDLKLLAYSQDRGEAVSGQMMLLTLGWQAQRSPQADYSMRLELVAPDGSAMTALTLPPGGEGYGTSRWTAGQVVRSQIPVRIPGRAGSGQYAWRVTLLDSRGASVGQVTLEQIQVIAPERVFALPSVSHRTDARLGDVIDLAGFDAPERLTAGQPLTVTLVWQAIAESDQDYKAFVHLLDADGRLVAQSDQVPVNWTRPTSGWQTGEFVSDPHTLDLKPDLPPGEYRMVVGMYAGNLQRLAVSTGGDVVELGKIQIVAR